MTPSEKLVSISLLEQVARILEPQAWRALGTGDTLAYRNRRVSSERKAQAAIAIVVERCAEVARSYADVAIEMAGDSVLLDPCLRGKGFSPENVAISEKMQMDGLIYSSRFHASQDIANALLALSNQDSEL